MTTLETSLAAVGLATLLTYSGTGPVAWFRDQWLQPALGKWSVSMFKCLRCTSVWCAGLLAVISSWLPLDGRWGVPDLAPVLIAPALATALGALYAIAAETKRV